jgi:hypothetical protein
MSFAKWTAAWFERAAEAEDPIATAYDGQRGSRPHQWFGSCYRAGFAYCGLLLLDHLRSGLHDVLSTPPYLPALDLDSAWDLHDSSPDWLVPLVDELAGEGVGLPPAPSLLGEHAWNPGFREWSRSVFPEATRDDQPFAEPGSYHFESFWSCWTAGYFAGAEALPEKLLTGFLDLARQQELPPAVLVFLEATYRDQLGERLAIAVEGGSLRSALRLASAGPLPRVDLPMFAPDLRLAGLSEEGPAPNHLAESDPWSPRAR